MDQVMWCPGISLEELEKQVILKAFRFYRGNKTKTAEALGIAIRTLDSKLEKYQDQTEKQEIKDAERRQADERELNRARGIPFSEGGGSTPGPHPLRHESSSSVSQKREVPLSERQKIQGVSPEQASQVPTRKAR